MHSAFSSLLLLASLSAAHMQLVSPPPFRSTYNPSYNYTTFDYSMTSPLASDGSNFPCKNYQVDMHDVPVSAKWTAGQSVSITLAGTANHGGGSCQLSISYDLGVTFSVIHEIVGGCPTQSTYSFTLPQELPAADKALFSWSWLNRYGNREMYQNCAPISVSNPNTNPPALVAPRMFQANIFSDGSCQTVEGEEVVYPLQAASREYGGTFATTDPTSVTTLSNCKFDEATWVSVETDSEAEQSPSPEEPVASPAPVAPSFIQKDSPSSSEKSLSWYPYKPSSKPWEHDRDPYPSSDTDSDWGPSDTEGDGWATATDSPGNTESYDGPWYPVPSTTDDGDDNGWQPPHHGHHHGHGSGGHDGRPSRSHHPDPWSSSPPVPSPSPPVASCTDNTLICSADGQSFYLCDHGSPVFMGPVAAGTECYQGEIRKKATGEACSTEGAFKCSADGQSFFVCDHGQYVSMGSVAAGTTCRNGVISKRSQTAIGEILRMHRRIVKVKL